jgi:hypothetical protein
MSIGLDWDCFVAARHASLAASAPRNDTCPDRNVTLSRFSGSTCADPYDALTAHDSLSILNSPR